MLRAKKLRASGHSAGRSAEFLATPDHPLQIVLRDGITGREIALGVSASLRDLEVLGSAGIHYGEGYENALRPNRQVLARKARASRVGQSLWDAVVERCGIEDPTA